MRFDILNRLGMKHECDRQTDGRTDRLYDGKDSASLRCLAKNREAVLMAVCWFCVFLITHYSLINQHVRVRVCLAANVTESSIDQVQLLCRSPAVPCPATSHRYSDFCDHGICCFNEGAGQEYCA